MKKVKSKKTSGKRDLKYCSNKYKSKTKTLIKWVRIT